MKEQILIISLILAVVLCLILLITNIINKRKVRKLTESIDNFIKDGKVLEMSTKDGAMAHLQSNIFELETRLVQEREYTKQEAKNNTEFISDISHQLKTPLAGLRLYCEMEHSTSPSTHTEKELRLVEKMEKLIHNVLKLEKIRSDTYVMNFNKTEISIILEELKTEFCTLFPQKQINIGGKGVLRCDKSWLREAFGNIIKNACEYTTADGKIDVTIEQSEKSVSVAIEDNGGGVPENELPLLFKRFHRTKNASSDSAGIGLSITKAIIEKHHGTIIVENGENGLRFSICFPIIDANLKL
ncbi:MAG: HAMP domain-containing histidine kinase [Clostridia bacterium]|nr:HAMP domain-containing histidine kinase [Clostridia bacterium]